MPSAKYRAFLLILAPLGITREDLRGVSYDYRVQSIDDRGRLSKASAPVVHSY